MEGSASQPIKSDTETQHESSITDLVREFGEKREDHVRTHYDVARKRLEEEAIVELYIPILAKKETFDILRKLYSNSEATEP